MPRDRILEAMGALNLYGLKSVIDEVLATGSRQRATPDMLLLTYLEAELAERTKHPVPAGIGPVDKDLDRLDFSTSPVYELQVRSLYEGRFLADMSNINLVDSTGTGKTHLAIAIARQAIRNGRWGRFFNLVDQVNQLEQEKLAGRGGKLADSLARQ